MTYDLLDYLRGDGRVYSLRYDWGGGGNEVVTTQRDGDRWFIVKWAKWEELFADATTVYRALDTSPGDGKVYALLDAGRTFGSAWAKRHMAVGELFERNPFVVWYDKATGRELSRAAHRTWLKLAAHHERWPDAGCRADDVLELAWCLDSAGSNVAERYWYARGYGLVGWQGGLGRSVIESVFPANAAPALHREALPWYKPSLTPLAPVPAPDAPSVPPFKLFCPVEFPYVITGRMNDSRSYGKHEGLDYAPVAGTPTPLGVRAAQAGTVVKVADVGATGYGKHIVIEHPWYGDTYRTVYGHLAAPLVTQGETVDAGELIGYAGSTGNSTGVHLHFSLQHIGEGLAGYSLADVENPEPYLVAAPPVVVAPVEPPTPEPVVEPPAPTVTPLLSLAFTREELTRLAALYTETAAIFQAAASRVA